MKAASDQVASCELFVVIVFHPARSTLEEVGGFVFSLPISLLFALSSLFHFICLSYFFFLIYSFLFLFIYFTLFLFIVLFMFLFAYFSLIYSFFDFSDFHFLFVL